jgi:stage V sporulation protein G
MRITNVKVYLRDEGRLKSYATVTFDDSFIVKGLKLIMGNKGFFVAMPSKRMKDGTYRDIAHPINSETRRMIEEAVLAEYEKEVSRKKGER